MCAVKKLRTESLGNKKLKRPSKAAKKSAPCNIVIVGATGVGKSSLVNYLAGRNVAKVGVGRPVTSRDEVPKYTCDFAGVPLILHDTWGIEADKVEDWERRISQILGLDSGESNSLFDVVVYCISAGGQRVQAHDLRMMRFFKGAGLSVVVALTKSDQVAKSEADKLIAVLPKSLPIVEVSSGVALRNGAIDPFGKDELLNAVVTEVAKNIDKKVSAYGCNKVAQWKDRMLEELEDKDISRLSNKDHEEWISSEAQEFSAKLPGLLSKYLIARLEALRRLSSENVPILDGLDISLSRSDGGGGLSIGDICGMIVLSPLFVPFAVWEFLVNGKENERNKLRDMVENATSQMEDYISDVALKVRERDGSKGRKKVAKKARAKTVKVKPRYILSPATGEKIRLK